MRKHNPYLFYQLAKTLAGLGSLQKEGGPVIELFGPLYQAQLSLRSFTADGSLLTPASKRAAKVLLKLVDDAALEKSDKASLS